MPMGALFPGKIELGQNPGRHNQGDNPIDQGNRGRQGRQENQRNGQQREQRRAALGGGVDGGRGQHQQRQHGDWTQVNHGGMLQGRTRQAGCRRGPVAQPLLERRAPIVQQVVAHVCSRAAYPDPATPPRLPDLRHLTGVGGSGESVQAACAKAIAVCATSSSL